MNRPEGYQLAEFAVNMPGCRYKVRPCHPQEPGSERVLRSAPGVLVTSKHELHNVFILPIDAEWVIIEAIQ